MIGGFDGCYLSIIVSLIRRRYGNVGANSGKTMGYPERHKRSAVVVAVYQHLGFPIRDISGKGVHVAGE